MEVGKGKGKHFCPCWLGKGWGITDAEGRRSYPARSKGGGGVLGERGLIDTLMVATKIVPS